MIHSTNVLGYFVHCLPCACGVCSDNDIHGVRGGRGGRGGREVIEGGLIQQ